MILRSPFLVGAGLVHTEPRSARPSSILKFLVSPPVLAACSTPPPQTHIPLVNPPPTLRNHLPPPAELTRVPYRSRARLQ